MEIIILNLNIFDQHYGGGSAGGSVALTFSAPCLFMENTKYLETMRRQIVIRLYNTLILLKVVLTTFIIMHQKN